MIATLDDAIRYFMKNILHGEGKIMNGYEGNYGKIAQAVSYKNEIYYIFFKRDWFNKFEQIFKKSGEGRGQTFNMKILKQAEREVSDKMKFIIVIMPDGIYSTPLSTAMQYISDNSTVRIPSTELGYEGSIPNRLMIRV